MARKRVISARKAKIHKEFLKICLIKKIKKTYPTIYFFKKLVKIKATLYKSTNIVSTIKCLILSKLKKNIKTTLIELLNDSKELAYLAKAARLKIKKTKKKYKPILKKMKKFERKFFKKSKLKKVRKKKKSYKKFKAKFFKLKKKLIRKKKQTKIDFIVQLEKVKIYLLNLKKYFYLLRRKKIKTKVSPLFFKKRTIIRPKYKLFEKRNKKIKYSSLTVKLTNKRSIKLKKNQFFTRLYQYFLIKNFATNYVNQKNDTIYKLIQIDNKNYTPINFHTPSLSLKINLNKKKHQFSLFLKKRFFFKKNKKLIQKIRKKKILININSSKVTFKWFKLVYILKKTKFKFKKFKFKKFKSHNYYDYFFKHNLKNLKLYQTNFFKKKIFYNPNINFLVQNNVIQKNIRDYVFVNKYSTKSSLIKFYTHHKLTKNIKHSIQKKKKVLFFNFWKKKLVAYKKARLEHWNLETHKTIKKRRYRKFLANYVKYLPKAVDFLIPFFINKFNMGISFWNSFSYMYLEMYKKTLIFKNIYQLPITPLFWDFLKFHNNKKQKIYFKIKRWIKKKKKIRKTFWMETKKQLPYFFKKQILKNQNQTNTVCFDFLTNYFSLINLKNNATRPYNSINSNKVLKLHNFRYKS